MKKPWFFAALPSVLFLSSCASEGEDLGQTLSNAGINTAIGVGIVFIVLIFISFVISLFRFIGKAEEKREAREERKAKENAIQRPKPVPDPEPVDKSGDLELVAVIAAAIASHEHVSPDTFVVRSVRRIQTENHWRRG